MKENEKANPDPSLMHVYKQESPQREMFFYIPPGVNFSDIYMDLQEVATALKIGKRMVNNLRRAGILSHTRLYKGGKIFYLKQEIAAMLKANIVEGKNSILKMKVFKSFIATAIAMASALPDWEFMLA